MAAAIALEGRLPMGRSAADSETLLDETAEAAAAELTFAGVYDVAPAARALVGAPGASLHPLQLNAVADTLEAALEHSAHLRGASDRFPALQRFAAAVDAAQLQPLAEAIRFAIDARTGTVLDRSSEMLAYVRSERRANAAQLKEVTEHWARELNRQGASELLSPVIRRDRLCCSVKRGRSGELPKGSVTLATSQSGSTLYMEPKPAIELNNAEARLTGEERTEEAVVVAELCDRMRESAAAIERAMWAVTMLDLASARAKHAKWLGGTRPQLMSLEEGRARGWVRLHGVRHPLLLQPTLEQLPPPPALEDASLDELGVNAAAGYVSSTSSASESESDREDDAIGAAASPGGPPRPVDLRVPPGVAVASITGPNTGGKTAALKAIGLSALMAKAGLFIHVAPDATLPGGAPPPGGASEAPAVTWFDAVLADLGDGQSLQQSLSTFSGHMRRICRILQAAGPSSMVLLDELGSGTDPAEGAALAIALLRRFSRQAAFTFTTTHHAELKQEADRDPAFVNAAMEFDTATLRPTYRLQWGVLGDSNALAVAESIGFDRRVVESARAAKGRLQMLTSAKHKRESLSGAIEDQIEVALQSAAAAAAARRAAEAGVAAVEAQLEKLRVAVKQLSGEAAGAEAAAAWEAAALTALPAAVAAGATTAAAAAAELRRVEASLPAAAEAASRLLGIQLGGELVADSDEDVDGEGWVPAVGEDVQVLKMGGVRGSVVAAPRDARPSSQLQVRVGKLALTVKMSEVARIPDALQPAPRSVKAVRGAKPAPQSKARQSAASSGSSTSAPSSADLGRVAFQVSSNTVDLRGMRANVALGALEDALGDDLSHLDTVFVVHGVGTGQLRKEVHAYLKSDPGVERFYLEENSNGGCTVVHFKR